MEKQVPNMLSRLKSSFSWGPVVGIWALLYTIFEALTLALTEYFLPEQDIDISRAFDSPQYNYNISEYGDHLLYVDSKDVRSKSKKEPIIIDQTYTHEIRKKNHSNRFTTVRPTIEQLIENQQI